MHLVGSKPKKKTKISILELDGLYCKMSHSERVWESLDLIEPSRVPNVALAALEAASELAAATRLRELIEAAAPVDYFKGASTRSWRAESEMNRIGKLDEVDANMFAWRLHYEIELIKNLARLTGIKYVRELPSCDLSAIGLLQRAERLLPEFKFKNHIGMTIEGVVAQLNEALEALRRSRQP